MICGHEHLVRPAKWCHPTERQGVRVRDRPVHWQMLLTCRRTMVCHRMNQKRIAIRVNPPIVARNVTKTTTPVGGELSCVSYGRVQTGYPLTSL